MLYEQLINFCKRHNIRCIEQNDIVFYFNFEPNSVFIDDKTFQEFYIAHAWHMTQPRFIEILKQRKELAAFWIPELL